MQGRIGMEDPDFASLRMDLMMASTALALAHAQGRLPENLREEFDKTINAPKQSAANLIAALRTADPWLAKMMEQGGKPAGSGAPARPKGVPPEATYDAAQKQWVAP